MSKCSISRLTVFCLFLLTFFSINLFSQNSAVSITDHGSYYEVILDYTGGISRYDMGQMYIQEVISIIPDYEQLLDSYLAEIAGSQTGLNNLIARSKNVRQNLPDDCTSEIEGMASVFNDTTSTIFDGYLSHDEFYTAQLLTDVARTTQCSGISVFGSRSEIGYTMTARILDWYGGTANQLPKIQSVTFSRNGDKSVCSIGYLCFVGIISGFNDNGIFTSILDSGTGEHYSSSNKRSYSMDLRYALENYSTLTDVADYLSDPVKHYTYNHLILLSDPSTSKVLENNFSGTGSNMHRALRSDTSSLNPGISWGFSDAIGTVNSFMLSGNHDNYSASQSNTQRWNSIKSQLQLCGDVVTLDELRGIASFCNGDGPQSQSTGDLYNASTQQVILFQPEELYLEVAFRTRNGGLPDIPLFSEIQVSFESGSSSSVDDNSLPTSFLLEQNYPNPFNPVTTIKYHLPANDFIKIYISDILGNNVETLFTGYKSAGVHEIKFDAGKYPSGVYIYSITNLHSTLCKKMVLLK